MGISEEIIRYELLESLYHVLYHIVASVLAPTSGNKMNVTHIGLHLFYGILRTIPINLDVFMIKYMVLYKEDSTKGLRYGRILTKLFR